MSDQFVLMEVAGMDALYAAIDRAYSKGYLPDAIREAWDAFDFRPASNESAEPVAWRWTLHMEQDQKRVRFTENADENPFGPPGVNYSDVYPLTKEPLYLVSLSAENRGEEVVFQSEQMPGVWMDVSKEQFEHTHHGRIVYVQQAAKETKE